MWMKLLPTAWDYLRLLPGQKFSSHLSTSPFMTVEPLINYVLNITGFLFTLQSRPVYVNEVIAHSLRGFGLTMEIAWGYSLAKNSGPSNINFPFYDSSKFDLLWVEYHRILVHITSSVSYDTRLGWAWASPTLAWLHCAHACVFSICNNSDWSYCPQLERFPVHDEIVRGYSLAKNSALTYQLLLLWQ